MELRSMTTPEEREQMARYGHVLLSEDRQIVELKDCQSTATGLVIRSGISFEQWERLGKTLESIKGSVGWWIGDWLNYGEREYGEMYAQAIEATAKNYQTLANYKYVAEHVEFSRRRENLSWSVHAEVASLTPIQQEEVLSQATNTLEARQLTQKIKGIKTKAVKESFADYFKRCFASKSGSVVIEYEGEKYKITHMRERVVSENGSLINELISMFEPINPSFETLFKNTAQRAAMERLLNKHGETKVRAMLNELPSIVGQKFAPVVTTPVQLENKLGDIIIFVKKGEADGKVAKIY